MATEHFTDKELQCKHCGVSKMDPTFMEILEKITRGDEQTTLSWKCLPLQNS
jgi:hypothetical protein